MTPRTTPEALSAGSTVASNRHWILLPFRLPLTLFALTWRTKTIRTQRCSNIIVVINNNSDNYN